MRSLSLSRRKFKAGAEMLNVAHRRATDGIKRQETTTTERGDVDFGVGLIAETYSVRLTNAASSAYHIKHNRTKSNIPDLSAYGNIGAWK